jgi:glycosyltransferase involved in cell wall biosynthesis
VYSPRVTLSVVIITYNEEANIGRAIESALPLVRDGRGEIIVVDSGSTDSTVEIAQAYKVKVFVEAWKGYAAQKNSAIEKAAGEWILSLDADEELDGELQRSLAEILECIEQAREFAANPNTHPTMLQDARAEVKERIGVDFDAEFAGLWIPRKNHFLGRWMKHGGFWPDPKLRLIRKGAGKFEDRAVHEDIRATGKTGQIRSGTIVHHSYPTLSEYIEHINHYSSLGAEMALAKGHAGFSFIDIAVRPAMTFIYNYFLRLGFLDGREGLLLHLNHAVYVSWKYAKAWEMAQDSKKV